jgi:tryptophan synthase alpha chain
MQFGLEKFCQKCNQIGIDGLIFPDLPLEEYLSEYQVIFEKYNLKNVFLITSQTSKKRILQINSVSDSFIYMVSSAAVTGSQSGFGTEQMNYFEQAIKFQIGAIIGSAFIKFIGNNPIEIIDEFVKNIRN